jgi:hypothetical protein
MNSEGGQLLVAGTKWPFFCGIIAISESAQGSLGRQQKAQSSAISVTGCSRTQFKFITFGGFRKSESRNGRRNLRNGRGAAVWPDSSGTGGASVAVNPTALSEEWPSTPRNGRPSKQWLRRVRNVAATDVSLATGS